MELIIEMEIVRGDGESPTPDDMTSPRAQTLLVAAGALAEQITARIEDTFAAHHDGLIMELRVRETRIEDGPLYGVRTNSFKRMAERL